jgi:ATP-dependent DNA helicase RecG
VLFVKTFVFFVVKKLYNKGHKENSHKDHKDDLLNDLIIFVSATMADFFDTPIEFLKGVGPQRSELLRKELNIFTFGDLLSHFPFRYVDRTKFYKVKEAHADLPYIQLKGVLKNAVIRGEKRKKFLTGKLEDETGSIDLVWFQSVNYIAPTLRLNAEYIVFGKPSLFNRNLNIVHPEMELAAEASSTIASAMQAVYSSTEKLKMRSLDSKGILRLEKNLQQQLSFTIKETLPPELIKGMKLMSRHEALINIHFPESIEKQKAAEHRLKFEELFYIQLKLLIQKIIRTEKYKGIPFSQIGENFNRFYKEYLPFPLTEAQKCVLREIRTDCGSGKQMNRLLQGDVGSGKTVVALMSMLMAIDNGYQASIMAPTEILANQHAETISSLLKGMDVNVAILTGSTKNKQRKIILEQLAEGNIDILIGTHALIEDDVQFKNLGFVVVDEQHRFGVEQRAKLTRKTSPSPTLPNGKGDADLQAASMPNYQTARNSSYGLIKEFQLERKRLTTEAEEVLWQHLKGKNLEQYKFRRQHIIDEFIVDFVCLSQNLIIEIDGKYHSKPEIIEADNLRTQILNSLGFKVIRYTNEEVFGDLQGVLEKIKTELSSNKASTSFPLGEGRDGASPHVLVMTATPIPRTLAMTLYGDLDVSVIDELPPGRKSIKTVHRFDTHRMQLWGFLKKEIELGRQVYIVYPLIEESEKMDLKNLMEGYESICRDFPRPKYQASIVHGKMKAKDKDYEMQRFIKGETNIMVATSVIEVGVNVPNASVMIVENAERFGLSQLHQLRGRVGRGADQSYCILMSSHKLTSEAKQRLNTMVETNDGFKIAEMDLQLRGAGDLQGTQQSGIPGLKIADLTRDGDVLQLARSAALKILNDDPELEHEKNFILKSYLTDHKKKKGDWSRVS